MLSKSSPPGIHQPGRRESALLPVQRRPIPTWPQRCQTFGQCIGGCSTRITFVHRAIFYSNKHTLSRSVICDVWSNIEQDQVHLASRTHFVDLVIHDTCSQKIIPYFADLVIHNICSQKIMPYFFDKLSTSIRNFAQWASTFCFSFLNHFRLWVKIFGANFLAEKFLG